MCLRSQRSASTIIIGCRQPTTDCCAALCATSSIAARRRSTPSAVGRACAVAKRKWIFPYQENADAMFNSSLIFELGVMKRLCRADIEAGAAQRAGICRGIPSAQFPQLLQRHPQPSNPSHKPSARVPRRQQLQILENAKESV